MPFHRKLSELKLLKAIEHLTTLPASKRTNNYVEGLMLQVVTRIKTATPFPKKAWKGYKASGKTWTWALIEIHRQVRRIVRNQAKLIKKTLLSLDGKIR